MKREYAFKNRHKKAISLALALTMTMGGGIPNIDTAKVDGKTKAKLKSNIAISHASTTTDVILEAEDLEISGNTINGFSQAGLDKYNLVAEDVNYDTIRLDMSSLGVTKIGANAFKAKFLYGKQVSVKLPSMLETIGVGAFEGNKGLVSVEFNNGLKTISDKSFYDSNISGNLTFPESLEELGEASFMSNSIESVTIPDNIKIMRGYIFSNNQITSANLGAMNRVSARRWRRDSGLAGRMVPMEMFSNNKLTSITLPEGIWAIGSSAFENNDIRELTVPKTITNIYMDAFQNNPNLSKVIFEKNVLADGSTTGIVQIDSYAFANCNISEVDFPDTVNEIGHDAFEYNKITDLQLPKNGWNIIGWDSFLGNPIVNLRGLNSGGNIFESGAFSKTKTLKNINFDDFRDSVNYFGYDTFVDGKLRSLEFPAHITEINNSFAQNTGWYDGDTRVALYRKTKGADDTLASGDYVTDNTLADGADYVVNPVLVEFDIKNTQGNALSGVPENLSITITRQVNSQEETIAVNPYMLDAKNFKIGDKITISTDIDDETLEDARSNLSQTGANKYEIVLNENNIEEVQYGDNYNVGYKKAKISLKYKQSANPMTQKFQVKFKIVDLKGDTIAVPAHIQDDLLNLLKVGSNDSLSLNASGTYDENTLATGDKIKLAPLADNKAYRLKLIDADTNGELSLAIDMDKDEKRVDNVSKTITYTKTVKVQYAKFERIFKTNFSLSEKPNDLQDANISITRQRNGVNETINGIDTSKWYTDYKEGDILSILPINDDKYKLSFVKDNPSYYGDPRHNAIQSVELKFGNQPYVDDDGYEYDSVSGQNIFTNTITENYNKYVGLLYTELQEYNVVDTEFELVDENGNVIEMPEVLKKDGIKMTRSYEDTSSGYSNTKYDNFDLEDKQYKFNLKDQLYFDYNALYNKEYNLDFLNSAGSSSSYITISKDDADTIFVREETNPLTREKTKYYKRKIKIRYIPYTAVYDLSLNFSLVDKDGLYIDFNSLTDEEKENFKGLILRKRPSEADEIIDVIPEEYRQDFKVGDELFLAKKSTDSKKFDLSDVWPIVVKDSIKLDKDSIYFYSWKDTSRKIVNFSGHKYISIRYATKEVKSNGGGATEIAKPEINVKTSLKFKLQGQDNLEIANLPLDAKKDILKINGEVKDLQEEIADLKIGDTITLNKKEIQVGNDRYTLDDYMLTLSEDNMGAVVGSTQDTILLKKEIILKYKKSSITAGGTGGTPEQPGTPQGPGTQPEQPGTPQGPGTQPEQPGTPQGPGTQPEQPGTPQGPITDDSSPTEDDSPTVTPTTQVPGENPPTSVPFVPSTIINPELIADIDEPVLTIINEEDTPLGDANVNLGEGTYTFLEEDTTPLGTAKIHDDNTLEILEINEDMVAKSLPKTGEQDNSLMTLLGASLLGLGAIIRRKKR